MAELRSRKVRIVNPIPGTNGWTGRNRADRYVRVGRAVYVGPNAIKFIEHPHNAVAKAKFEQAKAGYDDIARTMNISEVARLPVVRPERLFWRK